MSTMPEGYRTQSSDTSYEAEQVYFDLLRRMTPAERIRRACDLAEAGRRIALASLRERYPRATERDLILRLASLTIDPALLKAAFGWDPEEEPHDPGPDPRS